MATSHGYFDGSYDYRQMYDIHDLRGKLPLPAVYEDTLMYALTSNPDVSEFLHLVNKTRLPATLNNLQGDFTLFVPLNGGIPDEYLNPDQYRCRQIVLQHMLEHAVPPPFINRSRAMMLYSRVPGSSMLLENNPDMNPTINRYSQVIGHKKYGRGIVYFLNRMILPDQNPLSNIAI